MRHVGGLEVGDNLIAVTVIQIGKQHRQLASAEPVPHENEKTDQRQRNTRHRDETTDT